jgi:hypothetical protein
MLTKRKREANDWKIPRIWRAALYLYEPAGTEAEESGRGSLIDRQRLLCRCAATVLHAEVVDEFVDIQPPGNLRPGLSRLLTRVDQDPQLDYLIVSSRHRLVDDRDRLFELAWRLGLAGTVMVPADVADEFPWTGDTPSRP